jgi:hypothetical protein
MNARVSAARLLAICLLGLPLAAHAPAVQAADLSYGPEESYDRYRSAYDDPRYRDLYGPDSSSRYRPSYRDDRFAEAPPTYYPRGSTKDGDYLAPMPSPPRFSDAPRYRSACAPRREVKDRLRAEGWRDFHDAEPRGDVARVRARRPSGRLFVLDVDRCTGEIVRARSIGRDDADSWRDSYAYAPPPRRWQRPY